jgi:hypothetical protein
VSHHGHRNAQRRAELRAAAAVDVDRVVTLVHEHVGAGLHLGEDTVLAVEQMAAGAAARDDAGRERGRRECVEQHAQLARRLLVGGAALGEVVDVLHAALIGLHADIVQRAMRGGGARQRDRQGGIGNAAALEPDIEIDEHVELRAVPPRRAAIGRDQIEPVDHHADPGAARRGRSQAVDLRGARDRRAQQQVGDAGLEQGQQLARLGRADALGP